MEKYAQEVKSNFPSTANADLDTIDGTSRSGQSSPMLASDAFPLNFVPGIRFGTYNPPTYTLGAVYQSPKPGRFTSDNVGSWMAPDQRHCNPLGWLATFKMAIGHTGLATSSGVHRSSGVVMTKLAVCINAICAANDASCAPTKCYVSKQSKCVQFDSDVFPEYMSAVTKHHVNAASVEFKDGNYGECTGEAKQAARAVAAGS